MTIASVRNAPDRIATRRFGKITDHRIRNVPEPRLWPASVRDRTSIVRRPVSTARYMYGNDRIVYAAIRRTSEPFCDAASGNGPLLNERIRPNARMTAGMTNGISVTNSTTGRRRGRRRRTQYAVG